MHVYRLSFHAEQRRIAGMCADMSDVARMEYCKCVWTQHANKQGDYVDETDETTQQKYETAHAVFGINSIDKLVFDDAF